MAENLLTNLPHLQDGSGRFGNVVEGGQLGLGLNPAMIDSATPLGLPPASIVVLKTPTMFDDVPDIGRCIAAVLTQCCKSITGIDAAISLDTFESPVGHDGQTLRGPGNAKLAPINPTFVADEIAGNFVWEVITHWINSMSGINTNHADSRYLQDGRPWTVEMYSASIVALQFDQSGTPENMITAHYISNLFPTDVSELGVQRVHGETQHPERSITCVGHLVRTRRALAAGRELARSLMLNRADASLDLRGPTETEIDGSLVNTGVQQELSDLGL